MSKIGTTSNIQQPNKQCLNCKYWQPVSKSTYSFSIGGHCKTNYCKKQHFNK